MPTLFFWGRILSGLELNKRIRLADQKVTGTLLSPMFLVLGFQAHAIILSFLKVCVLGSQTQVFELARLVLCWPNLQLLKLVICIHLIFHIWRFQYLKLFWVYIFFWKFIPVILYFFMCLIFGDCKLLIIFRTYLAGIPGALFMILFLLERFLFCFCRD